MNNHILIIIVLIPGIFFLIIWKLSFWITLWSHPGWCVPCFGFALAKLPKFLPAPSVLWTFYFLEEHLIICAGSSLSIATCLLFVRRSPQTNDVTSTKPKPLAPPANDLVRLLPHHSRTITIKHRTILGFFASSQNCLEGRSPSKSTVFDSPPEMLLQFDLYFRSSAVRDFFQLRRRSLCGFTFPRTRTHERRSPPGARSVWCDVVSVAWLLLACLPSLVC